MHSLAFYQREFLIALKAKQLPKEPANLYNPADYILNLGGKRLRPVLTLIAAELFGASYKKAMPAAMAVEVFHNFTLVHDDIMDDAPLRRGQATVHEKWNVNTAILSGDVMLIRAYAYLQDYEPDMLKQLFEVFNKMAVEVCEGQQYDVDFESRTNVTIVEYLKMIEYKTSVLIAAALQMGSIIAGASHINQKYIYEFGKNLGLAFQLQDDYLDAFGNPETFGKQVGGDIIENKKTFLYLKAMELGSAVEQKNLLNHFTTEPEDQNTKIETVKSIFKSSGTDTATQTAIEEYTKKAFTSLSKIEASKEGITLLQKLAENLIQRSS